MLNNLASAREPDMTRRDVICSQCSAWFRRIELSSRPGTKGEYRCPACGAVIEFFDGANEVVYRLTVLPTRHLELWERALSKVPSHLDHPRSGRTQRLGQRLGKF